MFGSKNCELLVLQSGVSVSVQAGQGKYSHPSTEAASYSAVELGYPSEKIDMIMPYAEDETNPTGTVYGWVPVGVVMALIIKHGGIKSGEHPPFDMNMMQSAVLAEKLGSEK